MKRIISFILFFAVLTVGTVVPVIAQPEVGTFDSQLVFCTENDSNYRIPTVVTTASGAVIAFCNDRRETVSDYAEIQWLSYSIAADGKNFSASKYLCQRDGWSYIIGSAVYDAVVGKVMLIYYPTPISDAAKAEASQFITGIAIAESSDDGATWTHRKISLPQAPGSSYVASVHGAGAGIQLQYGDNAGRLVFAAKAGDSSLASVKVMESRMCGLLIYSDDHGETWTASLNTMPMGTDETAICELPNGKILISSRMISNTNGRVIAYSENGGRTVVTKNARIDTSLEVQCEYGIKGSVACIPNYDGQGNALTLFSSLNSPGPNRRNLCVWLSYDMGATWTDMVTVDAGLCSYSEMTYNPQTGLVSIVYERGDVTSYSSGISVASFDVEWLLANKRANTPLRGTMQLPNAVSSEIEQEGLLLELSRNFSSYAQNLGTDAHLGVNTLHFNGTGIQAPILDELTGNASYFIVFKSDTAVANDSAMLLKSTHANGIRTYLGATTESVTTDISDYKYNCAQAREYLDTIWHILAVTWNGDSQETALLTQFQDGMTTLKYEFGKNALRTSVKTGTLTVGSGFSGQIAEVLVYNRALTDTEVAETGLALAEKFGLTWTLGNEAPEAPIQNVDVWDGTVADAFDGGSGSESDPYSIKDAESLAYLAAVVNSGKGAGETSFAGKYFRLDCNIDLAGIPWTPIGNLYEGWVTNSVYFAGTFDGNGYAVYNLNSVSCLGTNATAAQATAGLFGAVLGGTVKNLGVASGIVRCTSGYAGGLVGAMNNGAVVENCYNRAKLIKIADTTDFTIMGGIVGRLAGGKIIDSVNYGTVDASVTTQRCSGNNSFGGIAGIANGTTELTRCYNTGTVKCGSEGRYGGIAGYSYTETVHVSSCHTSGIVTGSTTECGVLFGVVGKTGESAGSYQALTYYLAKASSVSCAPVGSDLLNATEGSITALYSEMLAGASVRCDTPTGLRYQTAISREQYDALVQRYGKENVKVGTLIAPSCYVSAAGAFTKEALDAYRLSAELTSVSYVDVTANDWYAVTDDEYIFAGSLVNIHPEHYRLTYAGIGYIAVTEAGTTAYYYSAYHARDNFRSIEAVVNAVLSDPCHGLSEKHYAAVEDIKAAIDAAQQ